MQQENQKFSTRTAFLLFAGLSFVLIALAVSRYYALSSSHFDLGIFLSWFTNIVEHGESGRVFLGHAHTASLPFLLFIEIIPFKFVAPAIVSLQAIALATPIWFLYRRFGNYAAFAFALYVPLWVNNYFDFHFDHLAVPLLLWFFLSATDGKAWWAAAAAVLLMLVKEPFALQTMSCGAFLLWSSVSDNRSNRNRYMLAGLFLVIIGAAYFYFTTQYLIPYFSGGSRGALDTGAFAWMGQSLGQILSYIMTHPTAIIAEIISTPGKLFYLFVIFGLLAFIPLLAPSYLIPTLPLLAIAMLSRLPNYYDYNSHYTAGLIIPVLFAFIHGLPKAHALWLKTTNWSLRKIMILRHLSVFTLNKLAHANSHQFALGVKEATLSKVFYVLIILWLIVGHVMLSPSPISRLFWSDKVWSFSWRAYVPTERDAMMKAAMLKYIPADPNVSVTTQNTVNWYHLAHRKVYMPFPFGIDSPRPVVDYSNRDLASLWHYTLSGYETPAITYNRYADYVVLDMKRPYFLADKGCDWIYGECKDKLLEMQFLDWVTYTRAHYLNVFEQDGFMILRRAE